MLTPPKPFACVIWEDAHGDVNAEMDAADTQRDFHKPAIYHTFGLVIVDDARGVTLACDWSPEGDTFRGRNFIPRGMIVDTYRIPFPRPRKKKEAAHAEPA